MSKVRIYEVAKELGMEQKAVVALFQSMGFGEVRNHMSSVEPEVVERVRRHIEKQKTSSVVEERVRADGRVIKRRTVNRPDAKPEAPQTAAPVSHAPPTAAAHGVSVPPNRAASPSQVVPAPVAASSAVASAPKASPVAGVAPPLSPVAAAPAGPAAHAAPVPSAAPPSSAATVSGAVLAASPTPPGGPLPTPVPAPIAPSGEVPVTSASTRAADSTTSTETQATAVAPAPTPLSAPTVEAPQISAAPAAREHEPSPSEAPVAVESPTVSSTSTVESVSQAASGARVEPAPATDKSPVARPTDDVGAPATFAEPEAVATPATAGPEPDMQTAAAIVSPTPPPPVHAVEAATESKSVAPVSQPQTAVSAPGSAPVSSTVTKPAAAAASTTASVPAAAASPTPSAPAPAPSAPVSTPSPASAPAAAAARPSASPAAGQQPAPRPSGPRTGIETWAGRPGVPMPQPAAARGASGPVPRRVQYDPRTGQTTGGGPRGNVRPGGPGPGGRPMGRPGGPGGARRGGAAAPRRPAAAVSTQEMSAHKKVIKIEEKVSLQTMASRMSLKATEVLMKLLQIGMTGVNINSTLDADTAKLLASEFGWDVEDVAVSEEEAIEAARQITGHAEGERLARPPIVTVMGHVDHGKTSLLDRIRKANVAAGEAGGITQHIGAYRVQTGKGMVTFLDTPGHEAFTQMRARGASVTDIVVLVVAADDGVMPQTKEAISHAKSAKVPIIVAINKMDKPGADPERVRRELVDLGLVPEAWGGETIYCEVSAKTGQNVDQLLEMIALQAEILELKANPKAPATGTVIEALLDRGKGPVARVLVTEGTLRTGDIILAGPAWGKVRAMTDEHGRAVAEAGPSTPVELLGLSDVPNAGDPMHAIKDAKKAQEIAEGRKSKVKNLVPATAKVSLEDLARRMAEADQMELRLIIKADVQGSVEAVADALAKLSTDKVRVAIIHAAVGGITEGDVNLAVASKAIIVGFGVRSAGKAGALAESEGVEIRLYNVIYTAVDDVKKAMAGLLAPKLVEKALGKAEVRQVFRVSKGGAIAGCMVSEGTIRRSGKARLVRDSVQVWEGKIGGLRRFKDDVGHVEHGMECGIMLEGYSDVKENDVIECFEVEEVAASL